jgi:hypothetical protein
MHLLDKMLVATASLVVTKERIRHRIASGKLLIVSTVDAAVAVVDFFDRGISSNLFKYLVLGLV